MGYARWMLEVRLETPKRVVAELAGRRVGTFWFSVQDWHYNPRIYWVGFRDLVADAVLAEVAPALYDAALAAIAPHEPLLLYTGAEEDSPLYPVLRQLGFREFRRVYSPALDVVAFDLSSLDEVARRFEALGYRTATLPDLEPTDAFKQQLHDLFNEVYADTSTVVPATPERFSLEAWWADVIDDEDIIPEAFFIALDGYELVGFANLMHSYLVPEAKGVELGTATFGTRRSHRHHHREIMLALKRQEIAYAQAHGYQAIRAEIDAENPWILQICAELPFVQGKDYISMVRVLNWDVTV